MKPLHERLNDRLDQVQSRHRYNGQYLRNFRLSPIEMERDPEIDELVVLAQRLQTAPQLEVAPDFSTQLQRRLLHRHTELKLTRNEKQQPLLSLFRTYPVRRIVLGIFILFCLLSSSVLVLAAQVSNPNNPLYGFKLLEQHLQVSLAGSADGQAALDLQFAQERLGTLSALADASHAGEYRQALLDLNQRMATATLAINALPAGSQRTQLLGQLASLTSNARQDLRSLLTRLALSERLATTDELARLGDNVPHLVSATLTLPARPNGFATITLVGSDMQPGAQILVDNKLLASSGTLENGQMIFVVAWHGEQHPQLLGILNPDGTATQIGATIIKIPSENKNNDGGNKNGDGNGNKPTTTPTPNGDGNKPTTAPPSHH